MINETMPTSSVNLGDNPKRVRTLTDPYIIAQIIRYQGKPRDLITEKEIVAYREEIILKRTLLNNNWARFYRFNGTPYSSAHFVSIRRKPLCTPVTQRKAKKRRVEEKQAERLKALLGWRATHPQWQDPDFQPDAQPHDGERLQLGPETTLRVLHTPGHASNHLCYLLEQERLLFTGDHVMQGSTVVINPPDGDMSAYLRSLRALLDEDLQWLAPGHGFLVARPHDVLRGLIAHRLRREAKVLRALQRHAPCTVDTLLPEVYDDVPAALHGVSARSLLAHLLKLRDDHVAACEAEVWSLRSAPAGQGGA